MRAVKYYQLFKVQIKITVNYQCTPTRMELSMQAALTSARGHLKHGGRDTQQYCALGDSLTACGAQHKTH